jgi:hypothetical protein
MSRVQEWLAAREPSPPGELLEHLAVPTGRGSLVGLLAGEARRALDGAVCRPGRRRDAAFLLLGADALFTYACEAAAEEEDVEAALRQVLDSARAGA